MHYAIISWTIDQFLSNFDLTFINFSFVNYLKITNGAVVLSHTVEVKKKLEEPEKVKLLKVFLAVDESIKTVQCKKESKKACNGKVA